MTIIQRTALVPYSAKQLFELVNHTEDYPRFLPWCSRAIVHTRTDTEVEATLDITWSGIHKSFTTKNILYPYERIEIILVDGPFRQLTGHWVFKSLGKSGCKVCLDLEVEFRGGMVDKLFQPIFNHIANSLVDAFIKRAREIYGQE